MRSPKPAWWLLYAMLPAAFALLVAAHLESPSAGWREIAEVVASLMIMGAMALWVRANRVALALEDDHQVPESMAEVHDSVWLGSLDPHSPQEEDGWRQEIFHA